MAVFDLRNVDDPSDFAMRLAGDFHTIEAGELSKLLASFSEAYIELGKQVQWENFELHVSGFQNGSFKTVFKKILSKDCSLFSRMSEAVVVSVLATMLVSFLEEPGFEKIEYEDHVEFLRGSERYLISREDFEAAQSLDRPERVGKPLARFFRRLSEIPTIIGFSLEPSSDENPKPYFFIPRVDFARVAEQADAEEDRRDERIIREERVSVQIVKAVFNDQARK